MKYSDMSYEQRIEWIASRFLLAVLNDGGKGIKIAASDVYQAISYESFEEGKQWEKKQREEERANDVTKE